MSKYVKNLVTDEVRKRLHGVNDALVVDISRLDAIKNSKVRAELRAKKIHLLVVKNSVAQRATAGTGLSAAFADLKGSTTVVWGGEDIVSLAKEITRLAGEKQYKELLAPRGGVLDGAALSADDVEKVSKWPSRAEQLSILVGQILAPGANLASQLNSAGGALASQIKQKGEEAEGDGAEEAPAAG